jgi:hypothetical protein
MAQLLEELSSDEILRDINEDRAVSGFPEVKGCEQIDSELSERKRYYCSTIKDSLDRLETASLIRVMTLTVETATLEGEIHASELIDELVDRYETETKGFLQAEAENIKKLTQIISDTASAGLSIDQLLSQIEAVARNWDKVAQPIQLSAKSRGIDHYPSMELAFSIRGLGIDLFNEHNLVLQSERLLALTQELFSELPDFAERAKQDAEQLGEIIENRKINEAQRSEWVREITYRAEVGVVFKGILSISPEGVSWKGKTYPLESITRVRWGGVSHYVNGIPTGTTYTIAFGDNRSETVVELRRRETFENFVEKLWKAVGVRLVIELFESLKEGRELIFGDASLRDDGVVLVRHKFLGKDRVRLPWSDVHIWSAGGAFYLGAKNDKKVYAMLPYIGIANVHVLEHAIRTSFKTGFSRCLSEIISKD